MRYGCTTTKSILQRRCMNNLLQPLCFKSICMPEEMPKYLKGFNDIPELENTNEMVQNIFSLEMSSKHDVRRAAASVYGDKYETKLEKNVANTTNQIRLLVEQLKKNKKDKQNKVFLIWLIDQRKKQLRKLQKVDINKYTDIIHEFEIPPLQSPFEPHNRYKFRKYKINVPLKKKREIEDFEDALVY